MRAAAKVVTGLLALVSAIAVARAAPGAMTDCLGGLCLGDSARDANDAVVMVGGMEYLRTAKQCLGTLSQVSLEHDFVVCFGRGSEVLTECQRIAMAYARPAMDFDPDGARYHAALESRKLEQGAEGWMASTSYKVEGAEVFLFSHGKLTGVSRMVLSRKTKMLPFARPPPALLPFSFKTGFEVVADIIKYESDRKAYEASLEAPPEDGFARWSVMVSTSQVGGCR